MPDPSTHFDASRFKTRFACEVRDFNPGDLLDRSELKRTDLFAQYALVAADQAIKDSGIDFSGMDPFDTGVIWGSGQGGMATFEEQVKEYATGDGTPRFSPFFVSKLIANMASGMISIKYRFMGINYLSTVSACSTSNTAFHGCIELYPAGQGEGHRCRRLGGADHCGVHRRVYGYEGHVHA